VTVSFFLFSSFLFQPVGFRERTRAYPTKPAICPFYCIALRGALVIALTISPRRRDRPIVRARVRSLARMYVRTRAYAGPIADRSCYGRVCTPFGIIRRVGRRPGPAVGKAARRNYKIVLRHPKRAQQTRPVAQDRRDLRMICTSRESLSLSLSLSLCVCVCVRASNFVRISGSPDRFANWLNRPCSCGPPRFSIACQNESVILLLGFFESRTLRKRRLPACTLRNDSPCVNEHSLIDLVFCKIARLRSRGEAALFAREFRS